MSNQYLLDTNILIYFFNGEPAVEFIFDEIEAGDAVGYYCPITWVELLCYPALSDPEANLMREYLQTLTRIPLTESILDCAANIRRNYRVGLADALIAACAITERCTIVTRNIEDFRRIDGLTILNPFD
ncbi:MAG: type II toxin-antitoxin system VapC family toxin [Oscillatoria sp. PMC 1051.18]|nr:type II toxin-antitoxin system VapC family toxin [Oscillatoria sp. PMC 1050.18]MEC5033004.1 type II toxin-antitoxin system VapC family toxin [Oscillatoria sp. PMC 1051.18]